MGYGTFAESNFWIKNLNKTPLNFVKQSSQVNNFTVFFQFFINVKKYVFNMLGLLRNSPYKQIWFGKLENWVDILIWCFWSKSTTNKVQI
jgi:hypothetical protein